MKKIIENALRLWDPYDLRIFPQDEYNDYTVQICKLIEETNNLTLETLTDFVYNLLKDGMSINQKEKKDTYVEIDKLDKVGSERFAELYFSIIERKDE